MNMKRLVYLSFGAKFLIALFFLVLIWVNYLLSQMSSSPTEECYNKNAKYVFDQSASLESIKREVRNFPEVLNACSRLSAEQGSGWTPLMYAAQSVNLERVKFYLQPEHFKPPYNLQINKISRNNMGETALHTAVQNATFPPQRSRTSYDIITLLLDKGANVNALDNDMNTPLHKTFAVYQEDRRRAIIQLLIDRGADINAQNKMGVTFMHLAVQNQASPTISWFMKKYGNRIDPFLKSQEQLYPSKMLTFEKLADLIGFDQTKSAVNEGMKYITKAR